MSADQQVHRHTNQLSTPCTLPFAFITRTYLSITMPFTTNQLNLNGSRAGKLEITLRPRQRIMHIHPAGNEGPKRKLCIGADPTLVMPAISMVFG